MGKLSASRVSCTSWQRLHEREKKTTKRRRRRRAAAVEMSDAVRSDGRGGARDETRHRGGVGPPDQGAADTHTHTHTQNTHKTQAQCHFRQQAVHGGGKESHGDETRVALLSSGESSPLPPGSGWKRKITRNYKRLSGGNGGSAAAAAAAHSLFSP